jgi:hypothetical protein
MVRKLQKVPAVLVVALLLSILIVPTAIATATLPESLDILSSKAFASVLQPNDLLVIFRYQISYTTLPTPESATDLYIFSLLNTTNTTEYGSVTPYAYMTRGYGYGLSAIYLSSTLAPPWGTSYQIRIMGNPAKFSSANLTNPIEFFLVTDCPMDTSATDIGNYIIEQMHELETPWVKTLVIPSSGGGMILSTIGEIYLTSAIPGFAAMAPQIAAIQTVLSPPAVLTYGNTTAVNLTGQYAGTWVGTALDSAGSLAISVFAFGCFLAIVIACKQKLGRVEPGYIAGCLFLIGASRTFRFPLEINLVLALLCGIYLAYILIFRNA